MEEKLSTRYRLSDLGNFIKRYPGEFQLVAILYPIIHFFIFVNFFTEMVDDLRRELEYLNTVNILIVIGVIALFVVNRINKRLKFDSSQLSLLTAVAFYFYIMNDYLFIYLGALLTPSIFKNSDKQSLILIDTYPGNFFEKIILFYHLALPLMLLLIALLLRHKERPYRLLRINLMSIKQITGAVLLGISAYVQVFDQNYVVFNFALKILLLLFGLVLLGLGGGSKPQSWAVFILIFVPLFAVFFSLYFQSSLLSWQFVTWTSLSWLSNASVLILVAVYILLVQRYLSAGDFRDKIYSSLQILVIPYLLFLESIITNGVFSYSIDDTSILISTGNWVFSFWPLALIFFSTSAVHLIRLNYLVLPEAELNSRYSNLVLISFVIYPFSFVTFGASSLVSLSLAHLGRAEIRRSQGTLRGAGITLFILSSFYLTLATLPILFSTLIGLFGD